MLDAKLVRNATNDIAAQLKKRGFVFDVAKFNALEEQRKQLRDCVAQVKKDAGG